MKQFPQERSRIAKDCASFKGVIGYYEVFKICWCPAIKCFVSEGEDLTSILYFKGNQCSEANMVKI